MSKASRWAVALLSAGWIIPLGVAGWLAAEAIALIDHTVAPYSEQFDRLVRARDLLAVGSAWLFAVVVSWAYVATGALVLKHPAPTEPGDGADGGNTQV